MTREEEILKAYNEQQTKLGNQEHTFMRGAKWADAHPRWISVEDELPKLNSGMVVVATYKGDIDFMIFSNSGWHNNKRWCVPKGIITHWMPLPQAPMKGE